MDRKLQQLKWAKNILRSKAFVVLTDKAGFIYLDAIDPESITDQNVLLAQQAEVTLFLEKLTDFAKLHDVAVEKLSGGRATTIKVERGRKPVAKKPVAKKKVTKIPVKQG